MPEIFDSSGVALELILKVSVISLHHSVVLDCYL